MPDKIDLAIILKSSSWILSNLAIRSRAVVISFRSWGESFSILGAKSEYECLKSL